MKISHTWDSLASKLALSPCLPVHAASSWLSSPCKGTLQQPSSLNHEAIWLHLSRFTTADLLPCTQTCTVQIQGTQTTCQGHLTGSRREAAGLQMWVTGRVWLKSPDSLGKLKTWVEWNVYRTQACCLLSEGVQVQILWTCVWWAARGTSRATPASLRLGAGPVPAAAADSYCAVHSFNQKQRLQCVSFGVTVCVSADRISALLICLIWWVMELLVQ